ncbi:MAG: Smr/MutS family protein [Spirochaetes bacterium]|nr:Smr/MutS family protein [Spirochaetota bacterium]
MGKKTPSDDDFLRHLGLKKDGPTEAAPKAAKAVPEPGKRRAPSSEEFRTQLGKYLGSVLPEKEADFKAPPARPANPFKNLEHFRAEEILDLHQMTVERAKSALNWTIKGMRSRGLRTLLLITGKGIHSPHGAILKTEIVNLLAHSDEIRRFQEAPARLGGGGAQLVEIKPEG